MKKTGKSMALCNQKGGVGKTVTAVNLGIGLVREGKRVLLVDVDPQGSWTASLGYQRPDQMENTLAEILGRIISDEPMSPVRVSSGKRKVLICFAIPMEVNCGYLTVLSHYLSGQQKPAQRARAFIFVTLLVKSPPHTPH